MSQWEIIISDCPEGSKSYQRTLHAVYSTAFIGLEEGVDYIRVYFEQHKEANLTHELLSEVTDINVSSVQKVPNVNWNKIWESNYAPVFHRSFLSDYKFISLNRHPYHMSTPS